ncbi:hypothetical protein H9X96_17405 [Pedobacter sp. N36a]|uniref:hypothetical protein n=1 Tax=Pedobacter sp. N36a TaxID=2767996 RepID=UPI0016573383|nr:hypothetical protein [Pedobacter sp. N36a]MBC8987549.1 hypothetical protein [Pedobacter sp. N36a]
MKQLLLEGNLHCKPMHYFARLSDEGVRGDAYETAVEIRNFSAQVLFTGDKSNMWPVAKKHFTMYKSYNSDVACGNLFCLYFYDISQQDMHSRKPIYFPEKAIDEYCILIHDAQEFVERVKKKLAEYHLDYGCQFVNYQDFKKINGYRNQFTKDVAYKNQNEFRFWIKYELVQDLNFSIGNIEDIAIIDKTENIIKNWEFMRIDENTASHISILGKSSEGYRELAGLNKSL